MVNNFPMDSRQFNVGAQRGVVIKLLLLLERILPSHGVPVLLYHRILDRGKKSRVTFVDTDTFHNHMSLLHQWGYQTIYVHELTAYIRGEKGAGERKVVITFDDGFADNYAACLYMAKFGFTAAIFITTKYIGLRSLKKPWGNDIPIGEYVYEFLNEQQILDLQKRGFEFYPHSHTHANLTQLDCISQVKEIDTSTVELVSLLKIQPVSYAYPFGKYNDSVVDLLYQRGYTSAFSTREGVNSPGENLFALRRNYLGGDVDEDYLRLSLTGKIRLYKFFSGLFHRLAR